MPSKSKASRLEQKAFWEERIKGRLDLLAGQGVTGESARKDAPLMKLRAKLRETEARLRAIAKGEQQTETLARRKAEKAALPKEPKKKKKVVEVVTQESKRQQKKKEKKEKKVVEDTPKQE